MLVLEGRAKRSLATAAPDCANKQPGAFFCCAGSGPLDADRGFRGPNVCLAALVAGRPELALAFLVEKECTDEKRIVAGCDGVRPGTGMDRGSCGRLRSRRMRFFIFVFVRGLRTRRLRDPRVSQRPRSTAPWWPAAWRSAPRGQRSQRSDLPRLQRLCLPAALSTVRNELSRPAACLSRLQRSRRAADAAVGPGRSPSGEDGRAGCAAAGDAQFDPASSAPELRPALPPSAPARDDNDQGRSPPPAPSKP
jgi:hypothetical protein